MKLLLDTNAFIWQIGMSHTMLGTSSRQAILQADTVYVSAISLVEMHIKTMLGKLNMPADASMVVEKAEDVLLPFNAAAADALRTIDVLKRHDPFDRMLLAQAQAEGLTFMTGDESLLALGLPFVVNARL